MNCREFRRKHDAYIDDTLSGVDIEGMNRHLRLCEQCAALDPLYLQDISRYLAERDLDFAYWPFNGTQGLGYGRTYGQTETYGLMNPQWSGYGNQQVLSVIQSLQAPTQGPGVNQ